MIQVPNSREEQVLSFLRTKEDNRVFAVINLSADTQEVHFPTRVHHGHYRVFDTGDSISFSSDERILMAPWQAKVCIGEK